MISEQFEATLIDFGFAKKYFEPDENGEIKHVKNKKITQFKGNLLFASINQM